MSVKIEQTVYEVLPVGQYRAKLSAVEEHEGQWGDFLKLIFTIEEGDHVGSNVTGVASARFSSRSKLYKWTKALLGGRAIPTSYMWSSDDLVGRRVLLSLDIIQDEDSEFNRIEGMFPLREPAKATVAPVQKDEIVWPDEPPPGLEDEPALPF